MKTVLVSGANGFIGRNLARELKAAGYRTIGIDIDQIAIENFDRVYQGRLLESLNDLFSKEKIDVFVHCAYHVGKDEYVTNVEGTIMWAREAQKKGVPLQIFVSSISARKDSLSVYGKLKYDTEKWFIQNDQVVIRFGLVIGNGGFFQRMVSMVRKWPVLPLLNRGRSSVYFVSIQDACDGIGHIVSGNDRVQRGNVFNIFQPDPVNLRFMLRLIKKQNKFFCIFIPIPYRLVLNTVLLLERIPFLKLRINSNNIRGLKQNDHLELDSDFLRFGYKNLKIDDLIKEAAE
jgi:nucleoside-diphosphate-sugar epimerase